MRAKHDPERSDGLQFFGQVDIAMRTRAMTVTLKDFCGQCLFSKTLAPARACIVREAQPALVGGARTGP